MDTVVLSTGVKRKRREAENTSLIKQSFFYVYGSVHRWSILIIVQRDATQTVYYSASSLYMFQVSTTPIIRLTQNCNYSLRYRSYFCVQLPPSNVEVAAQKIWPVPEAVVTVLRIPDDGWGWHPKHVERTCRITNRLFCVASRWQLLILIINKGFSAVTVWTGLWNSLRFYTAITYYLHTVYETTVLEYSNVQALQL